MARLNKLLTGHQITDEAINRADSTSLALGHDTILNDGTLEIWTGASGTGSQLTLTTDYTLGSEDTRLTTEAGETVYTKLAIVNGAYQSTDLYVTYKTVGDYSSVETINKSAVDIVYPVGCFYTQYPDADSNTEATEFPVAYRPATLFGGTWAEQWPTESVYFRTRGPLSDTGRTDGKQEDAFQGHLRDLGATEGTDGVFTTAAYGTGPSANGRAITTSAAVTSARIVTKNYITDGTSGTPRTSTETRTVNRRIKVWKRTA